MAWAISNSSTLLNLAVIGRLSLLREFHEKIIVPPAVWREVVTEGRGRTGAAEVEAARQAGWIEVIPPEDREFLRLLKRDLDDGEAETIALAVEQKAAIVFLDEADARQVAALYGLRKTGVIGILVRAKLQGILPSLKAELDRLRNEAGFWIAEELYQQVLNEVGEAGGGEGDHRGKAGFGEVRPETRMKEAIGMECWEGERCEYCDGPILEKKVDLLRKIRGTYVLVKNVPAGVCRECGTRYYAASVLKTIGATIAGRQKAVRKISMAVYSL